MPESYLHAYLHDGERVKIFTRSLKEVEFRPLPNLLPDFDNAMENDMRDSRPLV